MRLTRRPVCALLCLLAAIACLVRAFAIAYTAGDAQLLPPAACDADCRAVWRLYGDRADAWQYAGSLLLLAAPLLLIWPVLARMRRRSDGR